MGCRGLWGVGLWGETPRRHRHREAAGLAAHTCDHEKRRAAGRWGGLCLLVCVRRTIEGHLVVFIVVDVAHVPEDEEEEQSDAIGCTGLRAGRTPE